MQLKKNAMGEVVVYFIFGPAIASFIYTVMSDGNLSIKLMCLSSPLGKSSTHTHTHTHTGADVLL